MNLYNLTTDFIRVINGGMVVDDATGEILFDSDNLEELEMDYLEKLANVGLFVKNLEAEIEAIRNEERNLKDRREMKQRKVESLKRYMLESMEATDTKKVEDPRIAISTRKSQRVIIDDESQIPVDFIKYTKSVDKAKLKKVLKSTDISGAHIEENESLQLK